MQLDTANKISQFGYDHIRQSLILELGMGAQSVNIHSRVPIILSWWWWPYSLEVYPPVLSHGSLCRKKQWWHCRSWICCHGWAYRSPGWQLTVMVFYRCPGTVSPLLMLRSSYAKYSACDLLSCSGYQYWSPDASCLQSYGSQGP